MKTIDQIKAELRDIIELSDKATPGEWQHGGSLTPKNSLDIVYRTPNDRSSARGFIVGKSKQDIQDATFIAASRNLTPKMARALLTAITALETLAASEVSADPYEAYSHPEDARDALETICREWEAQA